MPKIAPASVTEYIIWTVAEILTVAISVVVSIAVMQGQ